MGDLPNVRQLPAFTTGNAGFAFDYQFIDVADFRGVRLGLGWAG